MNDTAHLVNFRAGDVVPGGSLPAARLDPKGRRGLVKRQPSQAKPRARTEVDIVHVHVHVHLHLQLQRAIAKQPRVPPHVVRSSHCLSVHLPPAQSRAYHLAKRAPAPSQSAIACTKSHARAPGHRGKLPSLAAPTSSSHTCVFASVHSARTHSLLLCRCIASVKPQHGFDCGVVGCFPDTEYVHRKSNSIFKPPN